MRAIISKLKDDFKFVDDNFKNMLLSLFIIGIFIFLSAFVKWFSIVPIIYVAMFTLFNRTGKALYYLIFLLPLMSIFKFNADGMYLLTICVAIVLCILGVQLLFDFFKKRKKINWFFSIMFAILIVYFSLPFTFDTRI